MHMCMLTTCNKHMHMHMHMHMHTCHHALLVHFDLIRTKHRFQPKARPQPQSYPSPTPNQVAGCGVRVTWWPPSEAVALPPPPLAVGEQGRGWEEHVVLGLLDDDLARFTRGVEASGRRVHTLTLASPSPRRHANPNPNPNPNP
jgi:hypothetical protein